MNIKSSKSNAANDFEWELVYSLPNLSLKKPFESEFIAVVPFDDGRLQKIISTVKMAAVLLTNFRTETGKQVKPCALIWRKDVPQSVKNTNAVVAFRNALAISCLVDGCANAIRSENVLEPIFADHFDFFPVELTKSGKGFIISTPATWGIWPKVDKFYGYTYSHLPISEQYKAIPDDILAEKILKQWRIRFISPGRDSWLTRLLFRSFEVAYQALLSPYRHSTLYEFGTHLSLWTCAFETLAQKRANRNVGYKDVLKLLGQHEWGVNELDYKRYKIHKENSPRGNLVQKLYKELHDARNSFFHGNPFTESRLYPFRNKKLPSLLQLSPTIYWTALTVYLPPLTPRKKVEAAGKAFLASMGRIKHKEGLLSAINTSLEDIYPQKNAERMIGPGKIDERH